MNVIIRDGKINIKSVVVLAMATIGILMVPIKSEALTVSTEEAMPGIDPSFADNEVPNALRVVVGGDGIASGSLLYRHLHEGVDYYSPVVPDLLKGKPGHEDGLRYEKWGPWKMGANQQNENITAVDHAKTGTAKWSGISVKGLVNGSTKTLRGTLSKGNRITILSMTSSYVYFDLSGYPSLSNQTDNKVGRVARSAVSLSGQESIVYGTSDAYQKNFKRMAKYTDMTESFAKGATLGTYYNNENAPWSVRNKKGEWRYLGYNAQGQPLKNPYFIEDHLSFLGNGGPQYYDWRKSPWNSGDSERNETCAVQGKNNFTLNGTISFPYDSKNAKEKREIIQGLSSKGLLPGSVDDFMNRVALLTHPTKQSAILAGQRKTGSSSCSEVYPRSMMIDNKKAMRDLYLSEIKIVESVTNRVVEVYRGSVNSNGSKIGGFVYPGMQYKVFIKIGNGADSNLISRALQAQMGIVYRNDNNSYPDLTVPASKTNQPQSSYKGNKGGIPGNKYGESSYFNAFNFKVHPSQRGYIDVYGFVGENHTGVDNLRYNNDLGVIRVKVNDAPRVVGDVGVSKIELVNRQTGTVDFRYIPGNPGGSFKKAIVPGKEYKVIYYAKYTGEDMKNERCWGGQNDIPYTPQDEYVPPTCETYIETKKVPFKYTLKKYSGGPKELDQKGPVSNNFKYNGTDDVLMKKNIEMKYETDYIMFQHPWLDTELQITAGSPANKHTGNDYMRAVIDDDFDVSINDLVVKPTTEYTDGSNQKTTYNVSYGATLKTPSYVKSEDYQAYINTEIIINGKRHNVKDQIVIGTMNNGRMTHILKDVDVPSSGKVEVVVTLNSDGKSYESGNYSNNIGRTNVNIVKVKDPTTGKSTDTVGSKSDNNNSPNKGGDANNNCLIPSTRNTWTSTHRKFSWNSNVMRYQKIGVPSSVSFNKYNYLYENLNEATETYSEEFKIEKILFKSKETVDNKRGVNNDGWVNLLNFDESKHAEIKAGYGFELKIITKYSTDALTKRVWKLSNNGSSGTSVNLLNSNPNYGMEDIFLELPGTDGTGGTQITRKILSSSGYGNTKQGLNVVKVPSSNGSSVEWTYTIRPMDTVGVGEVPKIFIPKNTKDGDYKLKIYTPPVSGAGSVNKGNYTSMCDRKEVIIKVKGSSTNDLNSHETQ